MRVYITLKGNEDTETNIIENVQDRCELYYRDDSGAFNHIHISDKALVIKRQDKEHSTLLSLHKDQGYAEIMTGEGSFKINLETVAFNIKDDMITIAYKIGDDLKEIEIKYLGV